MKKKIFILMIIIISIVLISFITNHIDKSRVRNSIEPKFTIKIVSDNGGKVTYWGLGYKVVRYISVSPNEPYKNNRGVKYGTWFMKYELPKYESIKIENLMTGKNIELFEGAEADFIANLLEDSKFVNEICNGLNTHKIEYNGEIYYLKSYCGEILKTDKQASISDKDLSKLLKIVGDYKIDKK